MVCIKYLSWDRESIFEKEKVSLLDLICNLVKFKSQIKTLVKITKLDYVRVKFHKKGPKLELKTGLKYEIL